ncbi:uncharacterized protein BcabD6B2_51650 [Babesia caballi]|uniref:CBF1-interacting co-repressor CIR N-terminal domain-containing protein n=1 Tax=Babesia caballi TaxID=5871 RepID=A0AAV4M1G3_BABCB|nr:hypothetical protein, conserved [Babesia caballi]
MGGHGGLNILPQKKWNVYRADRQYEVKFDEHRDIEKRLASREQRKRERLSDSLVELRRQSQGVRNLGGEAADSNHDPAFGNEQGEPRRRQRHGSRRNRNDRTYEAASNTRSRSRSPPKNDDRGNPAAAADTDPAEAPQAIEFDKKVTGAHINLFEAAEREAEERAEKRRESLIKSGSYVYNSGSRGPRSVNVYTDDASVALVPDIKQTATPWYMREKPEGGFAASGTDRPGGPRYLKSVSAYAGTQRYREEEEMAHHFANRLAKFQREKKLPME